MLQKILASLKSCSMALYFKVTTGHRSGKTSKPKMQAVAVPHDELVRLNVEAISEADALSHRLAGMSLEEQWSLHNGVYTAQLIQRAAQDVVNIDRTWGGLLLLDLRHPVGRLRRAAVRLQEGRRSSAARHLRYAREMLTRTQMAARSRGASDNSLQAAVQARAAVPAKS